jgi:gas vesicle protein
MSQPRKRKAKEKEVIMRKVINFLSGVIIGGLVGATLALLLTPSSGEQWRSQLQERVSRIRADVNQAAANRRADLEAQLAKLRAPQKS